MADGFDPVAVGVAQKCRVIGSVIAAQARRPVIGAAGGHAGIPERIDLALPARLEAPVAACGVVRLLALADGDIDTIRIGRPGTFAVAEPILAAADLDDAKRFHDRIIEALGSRDVRHRDGNVIEHRMAPQTSAKKAASTIASTVIARSNATKQSRVLARLW